MSGRSRQEIEVHLVQHMRENVASGDVERPVAFGADNGFAVSRFGGAARAPIVFADATTK
jgi:hypothetical protein